MKFNVNSSVGPFDLSLKKLEKEGGVGGELSRK